MIIFTDFIVLFVMPDDLNRAGRPVRGNDDQNVQTIMELLITAARIPIYQ
jgi:hypothetical protein